MRSPSKVVAVTPAAIEFEKRAIEREKKGQFRIAAHLWIRVGYCRINKCIQQCSAVTNRQPGAV